MCTQTMEQLASLVRTNKTLRKLDLSGKDYITRSYTKFKYAKKQEFVTGTQNLYDLLKKALCVFEIAKFLTAYTLFCV